MIFGDGSVSREGACLRCFIEWLPPLLRASQRLSNHKALWVVELHPVLTSTTPIPIPDQVVQVKGKGKGCRIDHACYHVSMKVEDKKYIQTVIMEEADRHYGTLRE